MMPAPPSPTSLSSPVKGIGGRNDLRARTSGKLSWPHAFTLAPGRTNSMWLAIFSIASAFGQTIIAEGVESREQVPYLRKPGCHELQGILLAEPMSAATFEKWQALRKRNRVHLLGARLAAGLQMASSAVSARPPRLSRWRNAPRAFHGSNSASGNAWTKEQPGKISAVEKPLTVAPPSLT
jgi:hypothetical protein